MFFLHFKIIFFLFLILPFLYLEDYDEVLRIHLIDLQDLQEEEEEEVEEEVEEVVVDDMKVVDRTEEW